MSETILIGLAGIIVAGIGAQWLAWRLRLPSILVLLVTGFIVGPVTKLIDIDLLFGDLLFPLISVSVAIILFEGGLSLSISELTKVGRAVLNLISIGALVTWSIGAAAAYLLLKFDPGLSILLGAIIVVTGPTVTGPLLRHVRPIAKLNSILKWEGIVIDPIGAMLAVLVFEVLLAGEFQRVPAVAMVFILKTIVIGTVIGAASALILITLLRYYWIPDSLQSPVSLMIVIASFAVSNLIQPESGLLTVTVMGITLANQKSVPVKHIAEFKENLRILLISGLFVLLAARLKVSDLAYVNLQSLAFLGVLILVARPVAVFLSTLGQGFSRKERLFIAWMAPRGIVAAAMASVIALSLAEAGRPQVEKLVPLTFITIIGTVTIYGLSASFVARRLKVAQPNPQGVLFIGSQPWVQAIALVVQEQGYTVRLGDSNWEKVSSARMAGLPAYFGNMLAERALNEIDLSGIGRLLALTSNDEINSLATLHFAQVFGRSEVYQLPSLDQRKHKETVARNLRGRLLFGEKVTHDYLTRRFEAGAIIKANQLTDEFNYEAFLDLYGETAIPLLLITPGGDLTVFTITDVRSPTSGQTLVSVVDPVDEPKAGESSDVRYRDVDQRFDDKLAKKLK